MHFKKTLHGNVIQDLYLTKQKHTGTIFKGLQLFPFYGAKRVTRMLPIDTKMFSTQHPSP